MSDTTTEMQSTLQWVGMDGIAVPIVMRTADGIAEKIAATTSAYVSLDKREAKGIHMSRLYALINQLSKLECNRDNIDQLLDDMICSQQGLSQHARISLRFNLVLKKIGITK